MTGLAVDASLDSTVQIKLSLPADDAIAPTFVDLVFDAQCLAGATQLATAQGNTVCQPCAKGEYEALGSCRPCPNTVNCDEEGRTVSDWKLKVGTWRTDDDSYDVLKCRFGVISCPGDGKNQASMYSPSQRRTTSSNATTGLNPYCSPNHVGHLCSACAPDFFLSWAGDGECHQCATGKSHWPTIGLLGGVFVFVASCLACVYTKYKKSSATNTAAAAAVAPSSLFSKIDSVLVLAKFKFFTLFLTFQVQFRSRLSR